MNFHDDGYQFFPRLLGAADLAALLAEVETLCDRARRGALTNTFSLADLKPHRNPGISPESLGREPFLLTQLPEISPTFHRILPQENLWQIAADLLQTDNPVYQFSNIIRKPSRIGPNLSWHRDYPNQYMCPAHSRHFFRLLIPLENMDRENGCTLAIPQSHLISDEEAQQIKSCADADPTHAIPLIAKAGDGVAIHPKLIHGGTENRSDRHRNLIVIQFAATTTEHLYSCEELFTGHTREEILASDTTNTTLS